MKHEACVRLFVCCAKSGTPSDPYLVEITAFHSVELVPKVKLEATFLVAALRVEGVSVDESLLALPDCSYLLPSGNCLKFCH